MSVTDAGEWRIVCGAMSVTDAGEWGVGGAGEWGVLVRVNGSLLVQAS